MDKKEAITVLDQVLDARSDGYEQSAWDFIKGLLEAAPNSEYKSALVIFREYFNSTTNLEFGDWLRERLNQQS